jgi:hypothetical protein
MSIIVPSLHSLADLSAMGERERERERKRANRDIKTSLR